MNVGMTGRLARAAATRPWLTIAAWAVLLVAAVLAMGRLGDVLTQEDRALTTTETMQAEDLIEQFRGSADDLPDVETIVVASDSLTFADASFQDALSRVADELAGIDGIESVTTPTLDAPFPVAEDGRSALVTATVALDAPDGVGDAINEATAALSGGGIDVYAYGNASANAVIDDLAEDTFVRGELIGAGIAVVVLILVFGALMAAGIPLMVGGIAIVTAIGATALVGQLFELSFFVVNMISMMGLALGVDYSLVIVQRFREELAHGRTVRDAVTVAGNTASRAVLISGATVLVSLGGLLVVKSTIMVSLAAGAIIVALMAIVTALTLLPAVLGLLGRRVNGGRLPLAHPGAEPRVWSAVARGVLRRPVASALAGTAILLALAFPALSMRLAFPGTDALPEDLGFRQAVDTLVEDYGYGQSATVVAITGTGGEQADVQALADAIEASPAFAETDVEWFADGAIIDTKDVFDGASQEATNAVQNLRDTLVPQFLDGTGATGYVGGQQADTIDFTRIIMDGVPWVALIVLGSSLVLLLVTFRSLTIAITAILLNTLSTAAAYGVLVMVFQYGWGADLLGMPVVGGIAPWIPVFLFAVLFGLSMDYHVFLLSRIAERFSQTGNTRDAVAFGLSRTGSLITGAALIMVAVFAGFALGDLAEFNQMGLGLAVAVVLDATVVRSLLAPAVMALLGRANWYLPRWLQWLPHLQVEGDGYLDEADARRDLDKQPALV